MAANKSGKTLDQYDEAIASAGSWKAAADILGISYSAMRARMNRAAAAGHEFPQLGEALFSMGEDSTVSILFSDSKPPTLEKALELCDVDLDVWEVEKWIWNRWEGFRKDKRTSIQFNHGVMHGAIVDSGKLVTHPLFQIKIWFRPKSSAELLLSKLEKYGPKRKAPAIVTPKKSKGGTDVCFEISIVDVHMGMQTWRGPADADYNFDIASRLYHRIIDDFIVEAKSYNVTQVTAPIGNDYLHTDNLLGATTKGTIQPEAIDLTRSFSVGEEVLISIIDKLAHNFGRVKIISIPGNHDMQNTFAMARVMNAWYRNDDRVEVDAEPETYKFHRHGLNLIGFEHGCSISPIRLAAVMANERPHDWAATKYREWHLGDQHRKGSSKPAVLEEQGVSVEFLPSLVPANIWHRRHAFNWQKRGAMGYMWDAEMGPIARLQRNIDSYTGDLMG